MSDATDATDPAPVLSREEAMGWLDTWDCRKAFDGGDGIDREELETILRSHEALRAERDRLAGEVARLREGRG